MQVLMMPKRICLIMIAIINKGKNMNHTGFDDGRKNLLDNGCVATYPSAGGRREGSRVRLPRKENARSHHQRLFKENVEKIGKV